MINHTTIIFYCQHSQLWKLLFLSINLLKGGASVVICKSFQDTNNNAVQHYYNQGYSCVLLDSQNPTIGIWDSSIEISGSELVCSFNRDNTNEAPGFFDLNNESPYIQTAYGSMKSSSRNILFIKVIF